MVNIINIRKVSNLRTFNYPGNFSFTGSWWQWFMYSLIFPSRGRLIFDTGKWGAPHTPPHALAVSTTARLGTPVMRGTHSKLELPTQMSRSVNMIKLNLTPVTVFRFIYHNIIDLTSIISWSACELVYIFPHKQT